MTSRSPGQPVRIRGAVPWRSLAIPALALAVLVVAGRFAVARWDVWEQFIASLGATAPLVYLLLWMLMVPCGFPAAALALTAGAAFGPWPGTGWALVGLVLSGLAMHALGRGLLQPRVTRFVSDRPRLATLHRAAGSHAVRLHLLARLSPLNYALVCYALAAGGAGLRTYLPGLAGAVPGLVAYVWLGAAARQGVDGADGAGWARIVIPVVGGIGLLALGVVLAGYARKAWQTSSDGAGDRRPGPAGAARGAIPEALMAELWVWEAAADRLQVPASLLAVTGYAREAFGTGIAEVRRHVSPDQRGTLTRRLQELLAGDETEFALEFSLQRQDGGHAWLAVRAAIERSPDGAATRVSGTWADVTARVEAEEERDRLFNVSLDLLAIGGFDGYLQQVNPAWVRVLGWSRDELMSRAVLEFIHPEDQELTAAAHRALAEDRVVADLATRFRCRDGTYRWLSWSSFPYPNRRLVFSVVRDITGQKDAERRLLDYQDRLRALSARLSVAEEHERRQLAVAIHDGLAQQLFAARAKVTLLRYPDKLADQAQIVTEALCMLDDSMREARSLSFELYPPVLYDVGLEAALAWLARHWSGRTGIECTVTAGAEANDPVHLAEDARALVYQSVRELLTNVAKHAEATSVRIEIVPDGAQLRVAVADNGRGMPVAAPVSQPDARDGSPGFGLFSIRERMRSVGGRFRLQSSPGAGCRVELTVPLAGAAGGDAAAAGPEA